MAVYPITTRANKKPYTNMFAKK